MRGDKGIEPGAGGRKRSDLCLTPARIAQSGASDFQCRATNGPRPRHLAQLRKLGRRAQSKAQSQACQPVELSK